MHDNTLLVNCSCLAAPGFTPIPIYPPVLIGMESCMLLYSFLQYMTCMALMASVWYLDSHNKNSVHQIICTLVALNTFMTRHKIKTLATGVVQLFLADQRDRKRWSKRCCGVASFVKDQSKRSFYIRIYDIKKQQMLWEQELYNQFVYKTPRKYFHTFEAENYQAALNFASEDEALKFQKTVDRNLHKLRHAVPPPLPPNRGNAAATPPCPKSCVNSSGKRGARAARRSLLWPQKYNAKVASQVPKQTTLYTIDEDTVATNQARPTGPSEMSPTRTEAPSKDGQVSDKKIPPGNSPAKTQKRGTPRKAATSTEKKGRPPNSPAGKTTHVEPNPQREKHSTSTNNRDKVRGRFLRTLLLHFRILCCPFMSFSGFARQRRTSRDRKK